MDRERLRTTAEVSAIRGRGWLRTLLQLLGIAAVLVGAFNLILADFVVTDAIFTSYRGLLAGAFTFQEATFADLALLVAGAILAWVV